MSLLPYFLGGYMVGWGIANAMKGEWTSAMWCWIAAVAVLVLSVGFSRWRERHSRHAAILDQRQARRDGYPAGPPVEVWSMNADEWEAARQKALSDIGCSYTDLAGMARFEDFYTPAHRKLWAAMGGWKGYHRWQEDLELKARDGHVNAERSRREER